jgi:Uri superfamily endonuclease
VQANDRAGRAVTVSGGEAQSGAYLLRILLAKSLSIRFGRLRNGEAIVLSAGEYLYVGSAMGQKGPSSLARRLVRHATRREGAPHAIRAAMLADFPRLGLGSGDLRLHRAKRLFWHVDYLLEPPQASLTHALAVRSRTPLELALAALLTAQSYTSTPVQGFGASDTRDGTHLFAVAPVEGWWPAFEEGAQDQQNHQPHAGHL